jgi:hypothetical protein
MTDEYNHELKLEWCQEYDYAAKWCAERGLKGQIGDPLPPDINPYIRTYICCDIEAFQERIRDFAYALDMNKITTD